MFSLTQVTGNSDARRSFLITMSLTDTQINLVGLNEGSIPTIPIEIVAP